MNTTIETAVRAHLAAASEQYLQAIVDHGIHNLTNQFHGDTDEEYMLFAEEFEKQISQLVDA